MSKYLKQLQTEDVIEQIITVPKREWIESVPFVQYFDVFGDDEGFKTIQNAIYSSNSILSILPYQEKIDLEDNFLYYQIPFENRSNGVIPNTFTIEYASGDELVDDGRGNLVNEEDEIVGNIFYNSGIIVVKGNGTFENETPYSDLINEDSIIHYDRETYFVKQNFFIKINPNDYNNSSNPSFFESESESPYFTKVILTNDLGEVILVASLNKPLPTNQDVLVVVDTTIPIY